MSIAQTDIEHWRSWIGCRESRTEMIDLGSVQRYAAAIGEPFDIEHRLPSLAHWACFLPVVAADAIGTDGHPRRGGFLPPVSLPRRMFAAGAMQFHGVLLPGVEAVRTSTIVDVSHKAGRSGDLVLVEVEHRIAQADRERIVETQTFVYRDAGAPSPAVVPTEVAMQPGDALWQPGAVDLFRFSAVTFNSHRIHYDLPYATEEEGYPGLVVHGPFTAARLLNHARRGGRTPRAFSFRAMAPLFADQPVVIIDDPDAQGAELRALRCDGVAAMTATVKY